MSRFTVSQSEVLLVNTALSIGNGFASKYHGVIAEDLGRAEEYLGELPEKRADNSVEFWSKYIKRIGSALIAEAPIIFLTTAGRGDAEKNIFAEKVDPFTGETVDGSLVFIGAVGGHAGVGLPYHNGITVGHIKFASTRLVEQEKAGLDFDILAHFNKTVN